MSNLAVKTLEMLNYEPTIQQKSLILALNDFINCRKAGDAFVLHGYAGTGKTSIMSAMVKAMTQLNIPHVLLAPTGRAAKVFAQYCGENVNTIHKRLYRADSPDPSSTTFFLSHNKEKGTLFIVDESSMISSGGLGGGLLEHLVKHVYTGEGCNIIFLGDTAQLPPVGQTGSPAMDAVRLKELGLTPYSFKLDEPARQAAESGILFNATHLRQCMSKTILPAPKLWIQNFSDVTVVDAHDIAESISDSYHKVGQDETIVITRSNWRANLYNNGIRRMVLDCEDMLERNERLVIAKNNYFWTKDVNEINFIANGDIVRISWTGRTETIYGHNYADVEIEYPGSEIGINAKLLIDCLTSDAPSLSTDEMNRIYTYIMEETEGSLSHKMKVVQTDPYYNALQAKYAYCLTCHKAQGGQWKHVFIDMGALQPDSLDINFFRWLYTAITRASEKVFFITPSIETE